MLQCVFVTNILARSSLYDYLLPDVDGAPLFAVGTCRKCAHTPARRPCDPMELNNTVALIGHNFDQWQIKGASFRSIGPGLDGDVDSVRPESLLLARVPSQPR